MPSAPVGAEPPAGARVGPAGEDGVAGAPDPSKRRAQIREWSISPVTASPRARASLTAEGKGAAVGIADAATRAREEAALAAGGLVGLSSPQWRT